MPPYWGESIAIYLGYYSSRVVSSSSKKCLWYKIGVARVACRSIAVALFVFIGVYVARAGIMQPTSLYESL